MYPSRWLMVKQGVLEGWWGLGGMAEGCWRGLGTVQVRIHFESLFVRYLWPLVRHHYPPSEARATLHNQGLKLYSTGPQLRTKAAAIALPLCLVGNVDVVSCRGPPPNDMSFADMQTCLGNVGNVVPTSRQIL